MVPTIQVLVTRCGLFQATDAETRPITDDFLEMFEAECERFGSCGERVLGLAYKVKAAEARSAYEERAPGALLEAGGGAPIPTTIRRT